jgi:hypothetical protein
LFRKLIPLEREQVSPRGIEVGTLEEDKMRKLVIALAAISALGFAIPVSTTQAEAQTIVIKKGGGHHHGGWRRSHNRADRVVIVKKRGHGHYHHGRGHGYGHRNHMH